MEYNILSCGAVADGRTNCATAIQNAVDTASAAGGGRVIIPAGQYLSGSVLLKDNVELYLESGAVLISSLDPVDIKPFPQGGNGVNPDDTADGWQSGFFLGASHAKNVTISGMGTIYGQGDQVFLDKNEDNGFHECPKTCEAFRPRMMLFEDVENFTVRDVTLKDAAFWTLHMAGCQNVRIDGIKILNDDRGANNDGIDPDCCRNVVIANCIVSTGDDAIVVKSTGPMSRRYGVCENITITNCVLHSRDSALKIGTETGCSIFIGAKAPILDGAQLGSLVVPFVPVEGDFQEIKDVVEKIWDWWMEEGKNRERIGETMKRVSLQKLLDVVEIKADARHVQEPRTNPYIFWKEEEVPGGWVNDIEEYRKHHLR